MKVLFLFMFVMLVASTLIFAMLSRAVLVEIEIASERIRGKFSGTNKSGKF